MNFRPVLNDKHRPTQAMDLGEAPLISGYVLRPLDINTATQQQIMLLRGIGQVTAERIVSARPFRTTYDLVYRDIISERLFSKIASQLTIGQPLRSVSQRKAGNATRHEHEALDQHSNTSRRVAVVGRELDRAAITSQW